MDSTQILEEQVVELLRTVYDPEINVNIYDLGLIYLITIDETNSVFIDMTLTSPACPVGPLIIKQVKRTLKKNLKGMKQLEVNLVFEPIWDPHNLPEEVKLELGVF